MTLIPEFEIGLWNGWILSAIFLFANYFIMLILPKENIKEMMDQVKQAKGKDKFLNIFSFVPYLGIMFYAVFAPLKLGTPWFYVGLTIFILGMIGEIISEVQLFSRKPGQPVFKGFYSISRSPIYVFYYIIIIGIGVAIASWLVSVLVILSVVLNHYIVLAEERFCLEKYGDAYREYMKKTPRYIGILKLKNGYNNKT